MFIEATSRVFGLLRLMRMLGTGIDPQVAELLTAKRTARDHAAHGVLEDALGMTPLEQLALGAVLDAAGMAGVPVEAALIELVAGQLHLVGIDDDDVVAHVHMRGEGRQMLAAQTHGDDRGQATHDQIRRVDQDPLLVDLARFGRVSAH